MNTSVKNEIARERARRNVQKLLDDDGRAITLDGEEARLTGRKLPFPWVRSLKSDKQIECNWQMVERVITQHDGKFST